MAKYMLIGGGDIGRGNTEYQTKEIDEEIVRMTNKENPTFLFIGLASSYSDSYYDAIKKIYKNLNCKTTYLKRSNLINNPNIVEEKIKTADIIYIGGGDTIKLLDYFSKYKIDKLLTDVSKENKVIAGISAGAIAIAKEGYSDSYILRNESIRHQFIKGLNLIDISICPHYESNGKKTQELKEDIKDKIIISLSDATAIKIDKKLEIITSINSKKVYKCYNEKNIYKEKIITNTNIDKEINVIKKDF